MAGGGELCKDLARVRAWDAPGYQGSLHVEENIHYRESLGYRRSRRLKGSILHVLAGKTLRLRGEAEAGAQVLEGYAL